MLPWSPSIALFKASQRFGKIIHVVGDKQVYDLYQKDLTKNKRIQGQLNLRV